MKKLLPILIVALFSTQTFAQKVPQEEPWAKTARIIAAEEAKMAARKKAQREADAKKLEKDMDAENKKNKWRLAL